MSLRGRYILKVCPECGSANVYEVGVSGISWSGHSGYTGGYTGASTQGKFPTKTYIPTKTYRCSDCNWSGDESELMDEFRSVIRKILKENQIEPPIKQMKTVAGSSGGSEQATHNRLVEGSNPSQPKSIWDMFLDKMLGEKKKDVK